jgi:hypothetical protein
MSDYDGTCGHGAVFAGVFFVQNKYPKSLLFFRKKTHISFFVVFWDFQAVGLCLTCLSSRLPGVEEEMTG